MEAKHTPGPWKATTVHGDSRSLMLVMAEGPTQIASVTEGTHADASLIAAAPEMAEALLCVIACAPS